MAKKGEKAHFPTGMQRRSVEGKPKGRKPERERTPVRRCRNDGYLMTETEWQAFRFTPACPRCGRNDFEKDFL